MGCDRDSAVLPVGGVASTPAGHAGPKNTPESPVEEDTLGVALAAVGIGNGNEEDQAIGVRYEQPCRRVECHLRVADKFDREGWGEGDPKLAGPV